MLGGHKDITGTLAALADGRCEVVEVVRGAAEPDDGEELDDPSAARARGRRARAAGGGTVVASPTPSPLRDVTPAQRADVARDQDWDPDATQAHSFATPIPVIPPAYMPSATSTS